MSYASELPNGIYGATNPGTMSGMTMTGYKPNPLNGSNFNILKLNVIAQGSNPVTSIPPTLVSLNPIPASSANTTRNLTFSPASPGINQLNGHFLINGSSFDMNVINYSIPLNNVEIWTLNNNSAIAHPFHIHDVQFYILDRNGVTPPAQEQGRKDVVLVKAQETVRFIAVFDDFANDTVPYMYHCHMLTHEDQGMMGQFKVVTSPQGLPSAINSDGLIIYPNPSNGVIKISTTGSDEINSIDIFDITGKLIISKKIKPGVSLIDIENLPKGILVIKVLTDNKIFSSKIVIN